MNLDISKWSIRKQTYFVMGVWLIIVILQFFEMKPTSWILFAGLYFCFCLSQLVTIRFSEGWRESIERLKPLIEKINEKLEEKLSSESKVD